MGRLEKARNLEHRQRLVFRFLGQAPFMAILVVILLAPLDRLAR